LSHERKGKLPGPVCIEIVEGNPHLRSLLSWHLTTSGLPSKSSAFIKQVEVFLTRQPMLVILDSELPDGDGIDFVAGCSDNSPWF